MPKIEVHVQPDHLSVLARTKKPTLAVAELVWNGLDADADEVRVRFIRNSMEGIEAITVEDDGNGLPYDDAKPAFGNLGGSPKTKAPRTERRRRLYHGRYGKGRFRAFHLGKTVDWRTRYLQDHQCLEYHITGHRSNLKYFDLSDRKQLTTKKTGTVVTITDLIKQWRLDGPKAEQEIAEHFALYLRQYQGARIIYDGKTIDPEALIESSATYPLTATYTEDGSEHKLEATLSVIEWKQDVERVLCLCDDEGFALEEVPPLIKAPRLNFTAYLKCALLRELADDNALGLGELHPPLKALLDEARAQLREHYRKRRTQISANTLEHWKDCNLYPYSGHAKTMTERTERQVFDLLAINLYEYLPEMEEAGERNIRFSLRLLKEAMRTDPSSLHRILEDVLDLPHQAQEELAGLLERTSLAGMISACKMIVDRMDLLAGLEELLFHKPYKEQLLERKQLHPILAENTWLFGEHFHLTSSDKSLTTVLRKYKQLLGDEGEIDVYDPVQVEGQSSGIVDLVLGRQAPCARGTQHDFLVVELKRPRHSLNDEDATQIRRYARAVIKDERFRETESRWTFWLLGNDMTDGIKMEAHNSDRPRGLIQTYTTPTRAEIWVKTWGEVIDECRGRLQTYQEHLQHEADRDRALEHLRQAYERYLPAAAAEASRTPQG